MYGPIARVMALVGTLALVVSIFPGASGATDDEGSTVATWQPWGDPVSSTAAATPATDPPTTETTRPSPTTTQAAGADSSASPVTTAATAATNTTNTTNRADAEPPASTTAGDSASTTRSSLEERASDGSLVAGSSLGVAALANVVNNGDGSYAVFYDVLVENTGDQALSDLSLTFDAVTTFTDGGTPLPFVVDEVASTDFVVNFAPGPPAIGFDGSLDTETLAPGQTLAVGASGTVIVSLTVTPSAAFGPYLASFTGRALGSVPVQDVSNDGSLTDTSDGAGGPADGDPSNDNVPTSVGFGEAPIIALAKQVVELVANPDSSYTLAYAIEVANPGDVDLLNVQVTDDLVAALAGITSFQVDSVRTTGMATNAGFNGANDQNLLSGDGTLAAGRAEIITLVITVQPSSIREPFANQAFGSGTSPAGVTVTDRSDSGTFGCSIAARRIREGTTANVATCVRPDPNDTHPGEPGDTGGADDPTVTELPVNPRIGTAKEVVEVTNNQDGTYDMVFRVRVQNAGDVQLGLVQATDDLEAAMQGTPFEVVSIANAAVDGLVTLTPNSAFTGVFDKNLLSGTDVLEPGEVGGIDVRLRISPSTSFGPWLNTVIVNGTDADGTVVADISDSGVEADPDATNPDAPGDTGGTDDPTPMQLPVPAFDLQLDKSGVVEPDGVTWTIVLSNLGPDAAPGPLVLTDTMPDGMTLVDAAVPDGWECQEVGQAFICEHPLPFANGRVDRFELTTSVPGNGTWTNQVTISTPIDGSDPTSDTAEVFTGTDIVLGPRLPVTGSTTQPLALLGLALFATGAAIIANPRRDVV